MPEINKNLRLAEKEVFGEENNLCGKGRTKTLLVLEEILCNFLILRYS